MLDLCQEVLEGDAEDALEDAKTALSLDAEVRAILAGHLLELPPIPADPVHSQELPPLIPKVAQDLPPLMSEGVQDRCSDAACGPAEMLGKVKSLASQLHEAALRADPDHVRRMIDNGASVNVPISCDDPDGDVFVTLLHVLSSRPDLPRGVEVMAEIARGKANLNARSSLGSTPLARACLHKHLGAAELLLELGADPSPLDDRGRSALHCAVSLEIDTTAMTATSVESTSGSLVSLIAAKIGKLDTCGNVPPLLEAIRQSNRPAVSALLRHGAKPKFLHVAVDQAPACIVDDLLRGQANPLEEDKEGKSVLDVAFKRGDEEITSLLRDFIGDYERRTYNSTAGVAPERLVRTVTGLSPLIQEGDQDDENTLGLSVDFCKQISVVTILATEAGRAMATKVKSRRPKAFDKVRSGFGFNPEWGDKVLALVQERFGKLQFLCRRMNQNRNFQFLVFVTLLVALFFPDVWIVCDIDGTDSLDWILVVVLVLFIVELLVQAIGTPKAYVISFFFWMDIIGLLSVPLDLSYIANNLPNSLNNAVVMRAARTARLGARAGRFTKLVKLLRFLPGMHEDVPQGSNGTAKMMSRLLTTSLSTRISCLIIVIVVLLPCFSLATYPEDDFSMKAWVSSLDFSLQRYGSAKLLQRATEFATFYDDKGYQPFELVYWDSFNGSLSIELNGQKPRRKTNELVIKADSGLVTASFNFGASNRTESICNMALIVVIIILMMGFSLLLSNSVSTIVLNPLNILLSGVQVMTTNIIKSVTKMTANCGGSDCEGSVCSLPRNSDDDENLHIGNDLLWVIDKLATLSAITMKTSPIDAATLEQLGESDRALLQGFSDTIPLARVRRSTHTDSSCSSDSRKFDEFHTEELVQTLERHLQQAGLAWGVVDSWEFNALEIEEQQRHLSCFCFVVFHLGLGYTSKQQGCLFSFIDAARLGYGHPAKIPYHNWYHAVDVTHSVFRLLNNCATERFLSNYERFALVTSAVCHDIGHPGLNNPFLVETAHELALRYNDHSPLENMHCARLFELLSQPKTAIFALLDRQQYKEVRQVCIEAILHTDNTHHFGMVKELQMLYEMNSDVFDMALQMFQVSQLDFPPREICDIFMEPEKRKLMRNLFLHFSDISNPMKPFPICKSWAWNILDEFFLQGDKEKELGLTLQPLNDRDKVNRPYSQVGFIEFFIAPFAFATVRLIPPLVALTDQMMANLAAWCEEWETMPLPKQEEEERILKLEALQERILKLEAKFIFREGF